MVDLKGQYQRIKDLVGKEFDEVLETAYYIGGPKVNQFKENLEEYLNAEFVVPCANGTDALQIALMALDLQPGDEVIVPSFTYVATAEVIGLLQLKPIMVDVDPDTFNVTAELIEPYIGPRTKAIVPVHLFGQSADMEPILQLAREHRLSVVEDNAQAIGSVYTFSDQRVQKTGTMGDIGCTSFYPSKNLGCYGDGGAMCTNDTILGEQLKMIANHGQQRRYYHDIIGVNSRLDALQAAVLDIKLRYLDDFNSARRKAADHYDAVFSDIPALQIPVRATNSTHVFHQYTLKVLDGSREQLSAYLNENQIANYVYYPVPLHRQKAYAAFYEGQQLPTSEQLCTQVISLPMHSELNLETLNYICDHVRQFYYKR